ncbi:hypothetical protein [Streptosporangium sp. NPDC020145]|uniref:hypothetical protein n=1 Tax=Streptosporangium sp. NPDC020145 TaxID=3154694 RepID=UPI0034488906
MNLPLTGHIYVQVAPEQIRKTLSDDGWSSFDFGPLRVQIPSGDLTRIRGARVLARTIAAQADFWDKDLAALEEVLTAAEQTATAQPTPAAEPAPSEDAELDAKVAAFMQTPETHRRGHRGGQ